MLSLLSGTNQVLLFTCHPTLADLFSDEVDSEAIEAEESLAAGS